MFGLNEYILGGAAAAFMGVSGFAYVQTQRVDTLRAQKIAVEAKFETCSARVANILEDRASDAEVDNIPDSDLSTVPDRWLRGAGTGN